FFMLFPVITPILVALFIHQISKIKHKIHTVYFVTLVRLIIFIYFIQFVRTGFYPFMQTVNWIPLLGINLDFYLDGLSLLFVLLISGIGTLVVLYSIYYLDTTERLGSFYVY